MGICQIFEELDERTFQYLQGCSDQIVKSFVSNFLNSNHYTKYDFDVRCPLLPAYDEEEDKSKKGVTKAIEILRNSVQLKGGNDENTIYLECRSKGAKKYYEISRARSIVTISYGKIGTKQAGTPNSFLSEGEATEFMEKKLAEKKKGGYKAVSKPNPYQKKLTEIDDYIRALPTSTTPTTANEKNGVTEEKKVSETIKMLSKTEVGKLKKAEATELIEKYKIDSKGLNTLVKMKEALNKYFESKATTGEEKDTAKEEGEEEEPPKKKGKVDEKKEKEGEKKGKVEEKKGKVAEKGDENSPFDILNPILRTVFEKFGGAELGTALSVCKTWNKALSAEGPVWERAYMNQWGSKVHPNRLEAMKALKVTWKTHYTKQYTYSGILDKATVGYVDKAGDAIEYLIARINNLHKPDDQFPAFPLHKKLKVISVGDDVCYGPAYYIPPKGTSEMYDLIKDISVEKLVEQYLPGEKDFPKILGGLCPTPENKEEDKEYIGLNYQNFRILVENSAKRGNGILRHFW